MIAFAFVLPILDCVDKHGAMRKGDRTKLEPNRHMCSVRRLHGPSGAMGNYEADPSSAGHVLSGVHRGLQAFWLARSSHAATVP